MKDHKASCGCPICSGKMSWADYHEWELNCLTEYGWFTHFVGDPSCGCGMNSHTHGLETFGHLDLQIVVPMREQVIQNIFGNIIKRIRDGEKFNPGEEVEGIIRDFKVKFVLRQEGDRDVLRIIIPDKHGKLSESEIDEYFVKQYQ